MSTADEGALDALLRAQAEHQRNGGPAFPWTYSQSNGMTLRDWFASQALVVVAADCTMVGSVDYEAVAQSAYELADHMIAERKRHEAHATV